MELNEQPYVAGEMKAIFFDNPSNFYKVILVEIEECNFKTDKDEIVVTGNFGEITTDTHYRFVGNVVNHPRYGTQFQAISYEREKPTGKNGMIAYLSSDRFPGIGKRTAEKIVNHFGENTIDAILDDPDSLAEISGLTKQKQELIYDVLQQSQGTEKTLIELANYGFSNNLAATIMNFYKADTLKTIRENPYQLIEDIEGLGFRTADRLAEDMGIPADDKNRIKGALLATINELCLSNGDTYVNSDELMDRSLQLLESSQRFLIEDSQLIEALVEMVQDMKIIEDERRFALPSLYFSEEGIASSLDRLLNNGKSVQYPGVDLKGEIGALQEKLGITYDNVQTGAIEKALTHAFFILTGGPGTGKTTVLNGIVKLFCELNGLPANPLEFHDGIYPIIMAAPTGRAAKRMNEMTGIPSSTIHRLLGLTGQENPNEEVYTAELEGKLLIIDEASMIDTWLLNRLLKSIPPGMQVIIVGDKDQLPSVGPGQVLHDLLASQVIPHIELEQIYRQADGSSIIPLAHDIKNGKIPTDFRNNQADRSFFPCQAAQIEPLIRIVVEKAKAKGFTSKDIQILAPMYKGPAGINALNAMMQEILNPNEGKKRREVKHFDFTYRVGDKILQLVNQPELNVFNGDMGEITSIQYAKETEDKVDEITVLFDATEVTYQKTDWNKFTLAYCCSIHKAQGSEFNMVILPMVRQYGRMLRRNLLYTAITRSKNKLILCGEEAAFTFATENAGDLRRTMLIEKLLRNKNKDKKIFTVEKKEVAKPAPKPSKPKNFTLTIDMVMGQEVDPLIGMDGTTPEQFMK
ncbi:MULTISPECIES: SF1B family DNA helicase RecD2 [unclassified Jeotgalibaca]|uniref:SF1B family DNA helicase RecD2 n=1 Tax=unclassified Jeotgalibaca TaxID=2621505 RepID=UPI003FD62CEB